MVITFIIILYFYFQGRFGSFHQSWEKSYTACPNFDSKAGKRNQIASNITIINYTTYFASPRCYGTCTNQNIQPFYHRAINHLPHHYCSHKPSWKQNLTNSLNFWGNPYIYTLLLFNLSHEDWSWKKKWVKSDMMKSEGVRDESELSGGEKTRQDWVGVHDGNENRDRKAENRAYKMLRERGVGCCWDLLKRSKISCKINKCNI